MRRRTECAVSVEVDLPPCWAVRLVVPDDITLTAAHVASDLESLLELPSHSDHSVDPMNGNSTRSRSAPSVERHAG